MGRSNPASLAKVVYDKNVEAMKKGDRFSFVREGGDACRIIPGGSLIFVRLANKPEIDYFFGKTMVEILWAG